MLDQKQRAAVLALYEKGHSHRSIARSLKLSRGAVREVIASGSLEVPTLVRAEIAEALLKAEPSLGEYVVAMKKHASGRGTLVLRKLLRMLHDYPRAPFLAAVRSAEQYGLYDPDRLERMVLQEIAHEYFVVPVKKEGDDE